MAPPGSPDQADTRPSGGTDHRDPSMRTDPVIIFYVQPARDSWYVITNGKLTVRRPSYQSAMQVAQMLARQSRRNGKEAMVTGIATTLLKIANQAARPACESA